MSIYIDNLSNVFETEIETTLDEPMVCSYDELAFCVINQGVKINIYVNTPIRVNNFMPVIMDDADHDEASVVVQIKPRNGRYFETKYENTRLYRMETVIPLYVNEVYHKLFPEKGPVLTLQDRAQIRMGDVTAARLITYSNYTKEKSILCMKLVDDMVNSKATMIKYFYLTQYLEENFGFDMYTLVSFAHSMIDVQEYVHCLNHSLKEGNPKLFFSIYPNTPYFEKNEKTFVKRVFDIPDVGKTVPSDEMVAIYRSIMRSRENILAYTNLMISMVKEKLIKFEEPAKPPHPKRTIVPDLSPYAPIDE